MMMCPCCGGTGRVHDLNIITPRAGNVLREVVAILNAATPGTVWTSSQIHEEVLARANTAPERKEIYNALGYLTRRGLMDHPRRDDYRKPLEVKHG